MRSAQRRISLSVVERLLAEPQGFTFFQAVRLLELYFLRTGGDRAHDIVPNRLRFRNSLTLGFPPSEIEQLIATDQQAKPLGPGAEYAGDGQKNDLSGVAITPAFFGLLGSLGTLPNHYTEKIAEREFFLRDKSARAFMDIFTTRATTLFYAAWKKYRLPFQYELDYQERFLPLVLSFAGLGYPGLRQQMQSDGAGRLHDESIAHYASAVAQRPLSVAWLQRLLSDYFRIPVRLEQFVGRWYAVPNNQKTALGRANADLGKTALCGQRIWQRNLRVRMWLGPLNKRQLQQFLPGGPATQVLDKWLSLMSGSTVEYEIKPILRKEEVSAVQLGGRQSHVHLGRDTFLCTFPSTCDRHDASYTLHAIE
jgi:type VI secretion system protein ImpH